MDGMIDAYTVCVACPMCVVCDINMCVREFVCVCLPHGCMAQVHMMWCCAGIVRTS